MEISDCELSIAKSSQLQSLFNLQYKYNSGFEVRDLTFWNRRIKYHFYRAFNRYYLIMNNDESGYAIVSYNSHPNSSGQIDILEVSCTTEHILAELLRSVKTLALEHSTNIIRCPALKESALDILLAKEGFTGHDQFDLLYFPIHDRQVEMSSWLFFLYDYA
jgi:hypothetical protein